MVIFLHPAQRKMTKGQILYGAIKIFYCNVFVILPKKDIPVYTVRGPIFVVTGSVSNKLISKPFFL